MGGGRSVPAVVAELANDARVSRVQPNWRYRVTQSLPDTQAKEPPALQYAAVKLKLADAHAMARGQGIKIATVNIGMVISQTKC